MEIEALYAIDVPAMAPEQTVDAVFADLAASLEALCATTQSQLFQLLMQQNTRLVRCEQKLQRGVQSNSELLTGKRVEIEEQQRAIEGLEARAKRMQQQLRKEKQERSEEKEWIVQLWPDGLALPTLLKPFEPSKEIAFVKDADDSKILQARLNRRVARERAIQQIEAAQQWKVVVTPATTNLNTGEVVPESVYYMNVVTGENVWQAPLAMVFEPPPQWDHAKMDWKDSYGIEYFFDKDPDAATRSEDGDTDSNGVDSESGGALEKTKPLARDDDKDDGDNEVEDKPTDPIALREQITQELEKFKHLEKELATSQSQQRSLALQLLNASRDTFEREKETLEAEDEERKDVERKKRKALLQEQAAAKAKAEAIENKSSKSVQVKFSKDSVGKKDLALSKDDELFEQELEEFVIQERADRPYLTAPVALDPRVKFHRQLDEEYVHMKSMEAKVLEIEQLEFDLLEKSSLRHEESKAKGEETKALCDEVRARQPEVDQDLQSVLKTITRLEIPFPPPTEPRPNEEELQRASVRFVTVKPLDDDEDDDETDGDKDANAAETSNKGGKSREAERQMTAAEVAKEGMSREEIEALLRDEAELLLLKSYVDAEQHWRDWEKDEIMRIEELTQAVNRRKSLENLQRQLALDLALYESDAPFFTRLSELENELNTRMWQIQADSQIERVRFMIERAAREEAIFQMNDRFEELKVQLEAAQRIPLQAINPLQRLELEEESRALCDSLGSKTSELQTKYSKEMEAKKLLVELESRSCGYVHQKLEEEMKLFSEKQALWDLNFSLGDEMQAARKTIERLYSLTEEQQQQSQRPENQSAVVAETEEKKQLQANQQQQEEATAVFEAKLQSLQQVRQFMFTCYDREARWRNLASIALIKDCSSNEWMTNMQREHHESMMTILQEQHDSEVLKLRKQIRLLQKVKAILHTQIDELHAKMDRIQLAYQESSDHVRKQTENVIHALNAEIELQKQALRDEQKRAAEERQRLTSEHDVIRKELETRLLELEEINEKQRHWLTAAKRELNAQRIANEELVKAYQSLEKRRAAETNDMRFRISSQIKKINNIEMWNLSLKLKAKEAHAERIQMQKEMDRLVEQHKQQQQLLRLKNWRHRVAAQAILTNVDLLFKFFAGGLEILSGATPEINSSLRANAAIEVMAALVQHCHQNSIKIICAKALGQLAWNANVTQRSLGWQAKRQWFGWVTTQSDKLLEKMARENVAFDAVADEESVEMDWSADPSNSTCVGESDYDAILRKGKKIQFVKSWHQFDELKFLDENSNNQEYIGLSSSILRTVIDLCKEPSNGPKDLENRDDEPTKEEKMQIQRNALLSLALIVMNSRNTSIIGRMDGFPREDTQVLRNAINALSNLAFQNKFNQLSITNHGAIPHLVSYCDGATDVDLILASTQALSHLSQEETSVCEVIFDAGGITVLTRLCHSPRIYDAVELDIYELIQTRSAEIIANVITILDNEDNESDHRSRNVASVILKEEEEELQASMQHGQRRKINDRRRIGGVTSFVLMCASCNRDVAFHAALVLGSIAQHDPIRAAIGNSGGIDALFLLADRPRDKEIMVQATWALANLTWNRDNQYRVARYFDHLFSICTLVSSSARAQSTNQELESASPERDEDEVSDDDLARQIREHGLCILANTLFYNDANRQLVASQHKWMGLIQRNCLQGQGDTLEHSARALCSLSYSDTIALAMGASSHKFESNNNDHSSNSTSNWELPYSGLKVFIRLCGCAANPLVQRNGLFGVINLCLHDANKTRMLDVPHGIETLVNLSGSTNKELCDPALEALELLADVSQLKKDGISSTNSLAVTDIKKLIALLSEATNPALVAMISDAIADEVWKKPSAKVKLRNEHGLEKLLELCVSPLSAVVGGGHSIPHDQELLLLISCLWALRNTIADNVRNQDLVVALGGVEQLVMLYDRQKRSEEVVEAILAVLVSLVMKHPRNSQQLVQFGLDMLISLAEKTDCTGSRDEEDRERTILPPLAPASSATASKSSPMKTAYNKISSTVAAASSSTDTRAESGRLELQNAALARDLLQLVAPYNTPPSTAGIASTPASTSPDKLTKMRRFQQMQAASLHHQQHLKQA